MGAQNNCVPMYRQIGLSVQVKYQKRARTELSFFKEFMKKKDITAKVNNALNLALFDLQIALTKKMKNSITRVSKELAIKIKDELKQQASVDKKVLAKETKRKKKD